MDEKRFFRPLPGGGYVIREQFGRDGEPTDRKMIADPGKEIIWENKSQNQK